MTDKTPESCSLFEAALEALDHPVLVHDHDTILFANAVARRHLRAKSANELLGRHITDIVHPDARPAGEVRRSLVLDHGQRMVGLPVKLRALDGTTLYARVDARRIHWDGGTAIVLTATFTDQP
jgi:PAS domain S-box-containing protein